MSERLDWNRDGRDWPNREASRWVEAGGLRWHVQVAGTGPVLLLIHGTGASTHSWRSLLPLLTPRFTVIAPDLPGHAFTDPLPAERLSLPGMTHALASLLEALALRPEAVVGHSAGAAIAARMSLDGDLSCRALVSLNGALLPLPGMAGLVFAPMARLFSANGWIARLVAARATDRRAVERLIDSTGSRLDERGIDLYARLVRSPAHVAGVLGMMANWDLGAMPDDLPRLAPALTLVVALGDRTVRPREAARVQQVLPGAHRVELEGLGHLAHEEAPERVARIIIEAATR